MDASRPKAPQYDEQAADPLGDHQVELLGRRPPAFLGGFERRDDARGIDLLQNVSLDVPGVPQVLVFAAVVTRRLGANAVLPALRWLVLVKELHRAFARTPRQTGANVGALGAPHLNARRSRRLLVHRFDRARAAFGQLTTWLRGVLQGGDGRPWPASQAPH